MAKIYYQWKVLGTVDGEDEPRLLTPWVESISRSGRVMFDTPELALEGLDDFGCRATAETEKWVLVKVTEEPLEDQPFKPKSA